MGAPDRATFAMRLLLAPRRRMWTVPPMADLLAAVILFLCIGLLWAIAAMLE